MPVGTKSRISLAKKVVARSLTGDILDASLRPGSIARFARFVRCTSSWMAWLKSLMTGLCCQIDA